MSSEVQSQGISRSVDWRLAGICVAAALYLPQSWFFLLDHPWDDYWRGWLRLLPGMPAFFPVAWMTLPQEGLTIGATSVATLLLAAGLFGLSRRSRTGFWIALAMTAALSGFSGFAARAVFLA